MTDTAVHLASYTSNGKSLLDLDGNLLSTGTYAGSPLDEQIDGTTDGTYFYTTRWANGTVTRYDMNWENPFVLFSPNLTTSFGIGIAYEVSSGSFWLSSNTTIYEYDASGLQLGSFSHAGGGGSLSFDNEDGTLWYVPNSSVAPLLHYATDGAFLGNVATPTRAGNVWGAEISTTGISAIPEPHATLSLAGLLWGGLCFRSRRRAAV